ncbi:hypothetical protein Dacet_0027 [Denitrovibrio acetiphilus DSM 12809]|uniref:Uncharacterized protein n=1 Tax=Denitrovibrio acetiphilus (strain DSM 12809 / NBRC 114555 / N2460) TaxID=522772 RepID=D4H186_DENA2|nr:hypothetical protein [Denitrovibrio acetiphilus]ADD66834.1 hypothetical protein Dacet_0027 [Denitrovibrio acetiphilus DSM 12809]
MIETIGIAILKSLAAFLFKSYMISQVKINIEGAPSWYMQPVEAQVCVFDHQSGGLEAIDKAKNYTYPKMENELSYILEATIQDKYKSLKDPKEKTFVSMFKNDKDAPVFIRKNMQFLNIDYDLDVKTAFVKGCIDKKTILAYQKERIETIKHELTHKRADEAFQEIENGDMSLE